MLYSLAKDIMVKVTYSRSHNKKKVIQLHSKNPTQTRLYFAASLHVLRSDRSSGFPYLVQILLRTRFQVVKPRNWFLKENLQNLKRIYLAYSDI